MTGSVDDPLLISALAASLVGFILASDCFDVLVFLGSWSWILLMNQSRRSFIGQSLTGAVAVSSLSGQFAQAAASIVEQQPHHAPKAKRVIFLFMHGGPSQVDTFDYKPRLQADAGKPLPFKTAPNISDPNGKLMASPWKFRQRGESGIWVSDLLPNIAKHADDLCVLRAVHSRGQSHGQAVCMLHTGSDNFVRPSVGAWVSYGLGGDNPDLPAFVSISPAVGHGGPRNYGTAFLPASHQATTIGKNGKLGNAKISHLEPTLPPDEQARRLAMLQTINRRHLERLGGDAHIQGAINAFDLASRMQRTAPEVMDVSREPKSVQSQYGLDVKETANFGKQCLLARRLVEHGVRYVELSTGNVWDQHGGLKKGHAKNALATDKPVAALLADLKQRGMLDETLVIWGGEFGRTPTTQGKDGRDHNPQGFTMWMAGGGVRGGVAHGESDDYGYYAQQDRVHMHDLHATMLHLLGVDHERLTYRHAGRDFRLTDVYGRVVDEVLV